jgi:hypothetical protein
MKIRVANPPDKDDNSNKIDKSLVLYLFRDGCKYTCEECYFYKEKKCALYGAEVEIKPYGGCNLWQRADGTEVNWINSTTKEETGYIENKGGFTCGKCEYFIADKQGCEKVNKNSKGDTPNKIVVGACCNGWEAKD